mgnify:FL=1
MQYECLKDPNLCHLDTTALYTIMILVVLIALYLWWEDRN